MFTSIFKDRDYFKTMLYIALPISIQSLIQASLSMIDQLMIGRLGDTSIAAVGLGSKFFFILLLSLGGITTAASIYTSQFWGKKDTKHIGQVLGSTLIYGMIITLIFILLALLVPKLVMSIYTQDITVINTGSSYMQIISLGCVPLLFVMTYSCILRSTENVKLPMYTGLFSVVINTLLNYLLIFGKFGLPELGVEGAAIATSMSRLFECILLLGIIYLKRYPAAVSVKDMFRISKKFMKVFLITMIPLLLNEGLWAVGDSIFSAIYGRMGTAQIAAMTITFPVQGLCIGFLSGIGSATGIMVGNRLGANDNEKAFEYSKRFIIIGIIGSVIIGALVILFSNIYVGAYNVSEEVQGYAVKILIMFGIVVWTKVSNMIISGGILRSGGETKITLYLEMFGMWGIGVPLGFLAAFVLKLPIHWVYLIISIEELVRFIIGLYFTHSKRWMKNLTEKMECV